jgi:hypothetical protein
MQTKIITVLCSLLVMITACEPKPDSVKLLDQLVVSDQL